MKTLVILTFAVFAFGVAPSIAESTESKTETKTTAPKKEDAAPPAVPDELIIKQLNKIIESQNLTINSLRSQLAEYKANPDLVQASIQNLKEMQNACARSKGFGLAIDQQTGFYRTDQNGKPFCIADPKSETVAEKGK